MADPDPRITGLDAERALIAAAVNGSSAAFDRIVRDHRDAVFAYLVRAGDCRRAEADDLAQDVFVTAWQKLSGFRHDAGLRTWLIAIARQKLRSHRRTLVRALRFHERLRREPRIDDAGPERDLALLDAALRGLPARLREPLYLHVFEGLGYALLAELLGVPLGTVKSRIAHARRKLASRVEVLAREEPRTASPSEREYQP
ncbi:MAG: sigma-70 family RNA polymerase sigma factor [Pseudomonadota bacterium]